MPVRITPATRKMTAPKRSDAEREAVRRRLALQIADNNGPALGQRLPRLHADRVAAFDDLPVDGREAIGDAIFGARVRNRPG